jgi:hypothetical protein
MYSLAAGTDEQIACGNDLAGLWRQRKAFNDLTNLFESEANECYVIKNDRGRVLLTSLTIQSHLRKDLALSRVVWSHKYRDRCCFDLLRC